VFFEIPLDQGFRAVFTDARSGERTPTGAVRRGLRPSPHRSRGAAESEHGQRSRPPRAERRGPPGARRSDRVGDRHRETGGGRRVRPGRRPPSGGRRRRRPAGAVDGTGRPVPAEASARRRGSGPAFGWEAGNGAVVRSRRNWGHPNWTQRGRFRLAPVADGSGNRVSVTRANGSGAGKPVSGPTCGIARHASRRDGRCEQVESKANARHSISGGPVHETPREGGKRKPTTRPGRFRFSARHPTLPRKMRASLRP
jgi:hypothetical protein